MHSWGKNGEQGFISHVKNIKKKKPYINSQNHIFFKIYYEVISG
jgi:hypothetical protein